jgi:hypothetical protein
MEPTLTMRPGPRRRCGSSACVTATWPTAEASRSLAADLPAETVALYAGRTAAFREAAAAAARRAEPAEEVAKFVERALTARRLKTRYRVGRDAARRAWVERLPDRLRDRVYERVLLRA